MKSSDTSRFIYPLFGTAILMMGGQVMADTVKWSELNGNEQAVLRPFAGDWDDFPEGKQTTLRRWAAKPPTERGRIKQRYTEWKQLSPAQQRKVAAQLQHYKAMPTAKKARIKVWYQWVKTLPLAEQQKLRQVWPDMSDAERKAYMQSLRQRYGGL
ncbi:MAG: DUF3106 domain-containing protein [Thiothrix sp.]|uniref:DUF3106 domain-containing protein n=1 Tax=Thiothrix sp. TaxID=1032 RepID=UPI0026092307|nr:DUF3106 domain-containing protein [Thiothrix sp.]MDD5394228.1 DUF3106 domain-containing protein [Thiothrix sp.]